MGARQDNEQRDRQNTCQPMMTVDGRTQVLQFVKMNKRFFEFELRLLRHNHASMKQTGIGIEYGSYVSHLEFKTKPPRRVPKRGHLPWQMAFC